MGNKFATKGATFVVVVVGGLGWRVLVGTNRERVLLNF